MEATVAIILVNYNGYDDTVECVKSIQNIKYKNYKIFIVDNCSSDAEKIQNDDFLIKNAEIICSNTNLGFSGGNNLAIEIALKEEFDYILLLNNDTTVTPDFLGELLETAQKKNVGAVTGKIYYYFHPESIWSAGGEYNRNTGLTIQFSGIDSGKYDIEKEITFATGCLLMFPAKVVREIGLLDESYFLYSEDSDYCQRIIDAGYKIMYSPKAVIYHKVSASTGDKSPLQQRYMMRNNLYMIKKYGVNPIKAYIELGWHMFKHIVRGRRDLMPTIQGVSDFLHNKIGKI